MLCILNVSMVVTQFLRRDRRGQYVLRFDVQSFRAEPLEHLSPRAASNIGHERVGHVTLSQPLKELLRAWNEPIANVYSAVQVNQKTIDG